jgi:predicted nuclease of predicted toxin-antitoxin system
VRYLIDEDLTDVARVAKGLGLDMLSAQELGRGGWTDEQQLAQAADDGRCIVTANRDDFRRLTDEFAFQERPHAGVLVVAHTLRTRGASAIAHALVAFDRTRERFPTDYLWTFLQPAD